MSAIPNRRSLLATSALVDFDPIVLAFIDDLVAREEISDGFALRCRACARHFLIWRQRCGVSLEAVNLTVIERFLQHDCDCRTVVPAPVGLRPWRKRRNSPELMRFILFLERTGRIETPGELDDNFRLLEEFLERLRGAGYASTGIARHRCGCAALIVWLHLSRLSLPELTPDVLARFRDRHVMCFIPEAFGGDRTYSRRGAYDEEIHKFLGHLAAMGRIESLEPASEKDLPEPLRRFSAWLERHRGIATSSIDKHIGVIAAVLPTLGDDPRSYDAALVRKVLWEQLETRTRQHARQLTTSMRMYLRFLVTEGSVSAALVEAVPNVPRWRLSPLPRYIPADDVERAVASCGDDPVGVRDRAILLLLARLALRAGDVVALCLDDIDWDRAEIRVSGKSRREAALPLPQDAGDALHAYIATARPGVDAEEVFLRARAPYRPFGCSGTVSAIARRALDRAEVTTLAGRGAHVFRHTQATALLRSGATLEVVQSLLRHASPDTTMVYAKTDAVMLQEVAQPWIGGIGR
ncbi:MAG: tyrosine-type recombinase/integrase [Chloroflexi bacterium]|nr:tyrosine-type recombinase/integrase [Chloroflexota bacterium]